MIDALVVGILSDTMSSLLPTNRTYVLFDYNILMEKMEDLNVKDYR